MDVALGNSMLLAGRLLFKMVKKTNLDLVTEKELI